MAAKALDLLLSVVLLQMIMGCFGEELDITVTTEALPPHNFHGPVMPPRPSNGMAPTPHHHHHHHPHPHPPTSSPVHSPTKAPPPSQPPTHHHHKGHAPVHPPTQSPVHPPRHGGAAPVHPPTQAPVHPPRHGGAAPLHPPTLAPSHPPPSFHFPRSFLAVQGVVYCKSCNYSGADTLSGASPILGATVKLQCNNTKYPLVQKATTDKNGYFFLEAPKTITTFGAHKCKVSLVSSPMASCSKPSDFHAGLVGAILRPEKPFVSQKLPFVLFSVGPFAFEPNCHH